MTDAENTKTITIAESDNYMVWKSEEPDGEDIYHIELNNVTLHFFIEEWQEFLGLMQEVMEK